MKTFTKTIAAIAVTALMQAPSFAGTWLKPESLIAVSEKDLDSVIQILLVDKDAKAADQLMADGKVRESASKRQEIVQTNRGSDSGLIGKIEFRFKGRHSQVLDNFGLRRRAQLNAGGAIR
jgi:hypothetical protein